jgi:signal peptidase I
MGTFAWRLCMAYGFVYIFWEYGVEITITEGPSMMNTLQGHGDEIVLMDRFTPARLGLQGGSSGSQRAELARRRQREFVKQHLHRASPQLWHEPKIPVNLLPSQDTWTRFWANFWTPISVGDVVVLQHPDRAGTVCKRVMGLPGDVVTKPISRRGASKLEWIGNLPMKHEVSPFSVQERQTSFLPPYQTSLGTLKRRSAATLTVPDGHLWVEGDNPWNSNDSRNYGAVPASLIVGRVVCRLWPIKGHAMIERGDRPININDSIARPLLAFSGSIVFPAGYRDQIIVRDYHQWKQICQGSSPSSHGTSSHICKTTGRINENASSMASVTGEPKE